ERASVPDVPRHHPAAVPARRRQELRRRPGAPRRRPGRPRGPGHRPRRRQRRRQVDPGQVRRRHLHHRRRRVLLRRPAGADQRPQGHRRPGHRGRLPGPRPGRQPRHRAEHVPRAGAQEGRPARRDLDGGARAADPGLALGAHRALGAPAGLQPLRRPAPDGGDRQGRAVELARRAPRRADRRPRGGADAPGARPRAAPGRQRPGRGAHLAQPQRRLRGRRHDHGAVPRPGRRHRAHPRRHQQPGGGADHRRSLRRPRRRPRLRLRDRL
ncbi:MAG: D-xylose transport ATP-binding protein XylG, partial [uncultured Quadrisphaera sp.]